MTKRTEKISCLITKAARTMLDKACFTYDSPQGKLITRMILTFCGESEIELVEDKPKVKRSKNKVYPSNLEEQFELLWCAKGKNGSKKDARVMYKKISEGESNEVCEAFTKELMDDMIKNQHKPGYQDRMLTRYLNGEYWEK